MTGIVSEPGRLALVALSALLVYAALVAMLRVSGKRTLSDMNAFDFVVTVALGSIVGSTALSPTVSVADGVVALFTLIVLQGAVALLASRSGVVRRAIKSEPRLVLHRGRMLDEAMRAERLSEAEVLAALRASGEADVSGVYAVVLETNGDLSVISNRPDGSAGAMELVPEARARERGDRR